MNTPDFSSITLAKALGNPNHDPKSGRFSGSPLVLSPSDDIQTLAEAREYYKAHILGVWTLVINRKAGSFKVKVDMRENEEHAYTKTFNGKRVFWPERAKKMSAIIHTMTHPGIVLENGDRDLFVERASAGGHEVVVLAWKQATQDYRFRSFHYWTPEEFKKLTAPTEKGCYQRAKPHGIRVQKDETPIRKSVGVTLGEHSGYESPPNFPNLHRTSLADSSEFGGAHAGIGWPHDETIRYVADLVKTLNQGKDWTEILIPAQTDAGNSIMLVFPNGNEHILTKSMYSFDDDSELLKAQQLAAGQRWITVNANRSADGKGTRLLVQETKHGSGVYHAIGGAGGALNYMKFRGLKPESSYKEQAAEKAKQRSEEKKQQRARDKELGLGASKKKARESVHSQEEQAAQAYIQKVAGKMGWKSEELEPNIPENVSDVTRNKLLKRHHSKLLERAEAAVELQHQNLLTDAIARDEAMGGETEPNEHTPDAKLDVSDLDDARPASASGLGFSAHYAERAAANGATEDVIREEADEKKMARQAAMTEGQRNSVKTRGNTAAQLKSEIAEIREPITSNVKAVLASAKDAVELIQARKEFKATLKAASKARKEIDEAVEEVKAINMDVVVDTSLDRIADDIEKDIRTIRTEAFLTAVKKDAPDYEKSLRQHIGAGAFNSINALALTAGGAALIDRSVVDVLGVGGAAQVLARRLHADLPADEMDKLTSGMEDFHLHHYMETSKNAMQEAQELHDAAKEIQLGEASHGADFEAARELLHRRTACVEKAHQILGTALGEMEANAALVTALKGGRSDNPMEVPLGKVSDEDAIRQVRAIGLHRGDYSIDRVAGNQVLTVTPEGLDRLSKPVDRMELDRTRATMEILNGEHDEDDWLPQGFAKRPDLALGLKPGIAATLAKPFAPSGDMRQSIKDYIGGRAADGDSPDSIVEDLQSADFFQKSGNTEAYRDALDDIAARTSEDGKLLRNEDLAESFNRYADEYVAREYGGKVAPIQRQNFEPDAVAQDALHRALAECPEGTAAYKPIGELSNDDQQTLRKFFHANVAHESDEAATLRERLEAMVHTEPERYLPDTTPEWIEWNKKAGEIEERLKAAMPEDIDALKNERREHAEKSPAGNDVFAQMGESPAWQEWNSQRKQLAEDIKGSSLDWEGYIKRMGLVNARATIQDLIRSRVGESFNKHYNTLNPNAPLKLGRQTVRNNLDHLDAVDPKAMAARLAKEKELADSVRKRKGNGQYDNGGIKEELDAAREEKAAFDESQMGFFSTEQEDMFGGSAEAEKPVKPLGADERYTLGHAAERTIAGMMGVVGQNFKPGQPLKIFSPTMSGPDVMRQRAIKIIAQNKRVALAAGTGAGKTAMMLGAFSHLQSQGKVKRGLFLVPSIVQGQIGAEALRFMEPGKYNWHCEPGASTEERVAAYKNPSHHFTVMTHQSFRDDMLHLGANHAGVEKHEMAQRLNAMKPEDRAAWMKGVMQKEGINYDFLAGDEAHNTLNRDGKDNSAMANVVDSVSANTEYYVHASADVVKNDLSEAADVMAKMDRTRYGDKAAFMRRYGVNTQASKDALKRELIRHVLPFKLEPKVRADKKEISVTPSEAQNAELAELDKNLGRVRMARMEGKTDVEAMKSISPNSFKDAPEDKHEAIAKELSSSIGIIKGSAVRAILDSSPDSAKIDALSKIAMERKGKPGVVFAHSLAAVENIKARLEADGHRVMTLTGADSSSDKAEKIRGFSPDTGESSHDILVASDAGATGANLQHGQYLVQFETPQTAMVWNQRRGRIFRIGQSKDVELIDLLSDHPSEKRNRERLKNKDALRELMSSSMEGLDDSSLAMFLHERKVHRNAELLA